MPKVKALKDVYLGSHGYHAKDEEFHYAGPENKNLEVLGGSSEESDGDGESAPESKDTKRKSK